MQKIDGTTIKINRGDILTLTLEVKYDNGETYTFQNGDKVVFSIYNKNELDKNAVVLKEFNVSETSESLTITLSSEETKIGNLINKPIEYWYEVELNNQYTIIGYDEDGAKVLQLFPEGSKVQ